MNRDTLREMIYESLMTELHKKGHKDPKGRELMKGEEELEEAKLNKKDIAYQLKIDYSGNTPPKIVRLTNKEISIFYGYKVNPKDVIKSIQKLEPVELKHKKWSSIMSGGGVHTFTYDLQENKVNEKTLKKGDVIKFKNGESIYIIGPKGDGYDYQGRGRERGHHPKKWFDRMIGTGKAVVESYVRDADTPGYFSPWSSEYKKDKKRKNEYAAMNKMSDYKKKERPADIEEGKPMFQDTPNEFAYLDFKKWAYKKRGQIKKALLKALGNREDGTKMFIALRDIWLQWANAHAKEWSYAHSTNVAKKDFGRALAVMMKKDGLILSKSGNKLTTITEAVYDKILKAVPDSYSYKKLAADIARMIKDEYGSHNIKPFIKELSKLLKENKINEASNLWKHFDAKMKLQDEIMDLEYEMKMINKDLAQLHKDMEQEAEPEGGPKATRYGRDIEKKEKEYKKKKAEFKKLMAKLDKMEMY